MNQTIFQAIFSSSFSFFRNRIEELGIEIRESMEEEDKGSNPLIILRHAEQKDSLLMRLLRYRKKPIITNDGGGGGGGGSSSSESPSSPAEGLKTEATEPAEDSVLKRFLRSWTKLRIQHSSTSDGVGGSSSSNKSPPSPAETLKSEPAPSVNSKEEEYVLEIAGSIAVDELVMADSPDPDGFSEIERQVGFSRFDLLIGTRIEKRSEINQDLI